MNLSPLRVVALVSFAVAQLAVASPAPNKPGAYWVSSKVDKVPIYSAPDGHAKVISWTLYRWKVSVLETKNGFGRIGKFVPGGQYGLPGEVASWIALRDLDTVRPPENAESAGDPEFTKYIVSGDNFQMHRAAFIKGTSELIAAHVCTVADFKEQGGWSLDPDNRSSVVYFTYCGGMTSANRVFLNVKTGHGYK